MESMGTSKKVTLTDIAKATNLSLPTVCKIIRNYPNYEPARETRELVLKTAKEMGYSSYNVHGIYKRKYERIEVNVYADIEIRYKATNMIHDKGSAVVKNISKGGALLANLKLEKNSIPVKPFICNVKILDEKFRDTNIIGEPVRLGNNNGNLYLGLVFKNISNGFNE